MSFQDIGVGRRKQSQEESSSSVGKNDKSSGSGGNNPLVSAGQMFSRLVIHQSSPGKPPVIPVAPTSFRRQSPPVPEISTARRSRGLSDELSSIDDDSDNVVILEAQSTENEAIERELTEKSDEEESEGDSCEYMDGTDPMLAYVAKKSARTPSIYARLTSAIAHFQVSLAISICLCVDLFIMR